LLSDLLECIYNAQLFDGLCFGFGCRRQQKRHVAAPPPAGVRRRTRRKRQKSVGRDKGSLTEQQTEGNRNNNGTDKEKTQQRTARPRQPLSRTALALHPPPGRAREFPPRRTPAPEPSVTAQGMEHRALFGQGGSAPTPPLCPFLESGEN